MRPGALAAALVLLGASPLPLRAEGAACDRKIAVTGHAQASHAPDFAELSFATEAKAATVAAAFDGAAKAVAAITALAREHGAGLNDIRTTALVLEAATRTVSRTLGANQQEPDGYRAASKVSVRLADRTRLADLVRRTIEGGAAQIESVDFGLADPTKVEAALLVAAGRDARARAAEVAEAAGARIGPLCNLTAGKVQQTPPPMPDSRPRGKKLGSASRYEGATPGLSVPIEGGTIDLAAEVSAVYAAQP